MTQFKGGSVTLFFKGEKRLQAWCEFPDSFDI